MLVQLSLGTGLILVTMLLSGSAFLIVETMFSLRRPWLRRPPHAPKLLFAMCVSVFWVLALMTVSVWSWAFSYWGLGIFATLEEAVYFSLVSFTTLGFGDVLLPQEWRLLSGMEAVNGLLMFGLLTAVLVEVLRRGREVQAEYEGRS